MQLLQLVMSVRLILVRVDCALGICDAPCCTAPAKLTVMGTDGECEVGTACDMAAAVYFACGGCYAAKIGGGGRRNEITRVDGVEI